MTVTQINELKATRMGLIEESRKLNNATWDAETKKHRDFSGDEQTKFDQLQKEIDAQTRTIEREEKLAGFDKTNQRAAPTPPESPENNPDAPPEVRTAAERLRARRGSDEYRASFNRFLGGGGERALSAKELRDLSVDSDADGGYLVTPVQMVEGMLRNLDDQVFIRGKARKFQLIQAKSLGVVRRTSKASTFAWGGEVTEPSADSALKFGQRELNPHFMSGLIKVSRDLLRNSTHSPEMIVNEELAINSAELEEQAFITGDGQGKPLGLMTVSSDGISASRDISTDNTSTAITADGLLNAKYNQKAAYRRTSEWMFHRDAVKMIAKLKDANDHYLWEPSLKAGEPDRIAGLPYEESEWMPNTFTTGLYVGLLADWRYYWIVDALDYQMQHLKEKYALENKDGFLVRRKLDGQPVLEEAFTRVKLG